MHRHIQQLNWVSFSSGLMHCAPKGALTFREVYHIIHRMCLKRAYLYVNRFWGVHKGQYINICITHIPLVNGSRPPFNTSACARPVRDDDKNLRWRQEREAPLPKNKPSSMDSGHSAAYFAYFCLVLRRKGKKKRMRGHEVVAESSHANTNAAFK